MQAFIPADFEKNNVSVFQRLQERHKRIIEKNRDSIEGKRVIDLACNNGRWTYAAVAAGARSVIGIEGRKEKVEEAKKIMRSLTTAETYDFAVADIFDWLTANRNQPVDTILCLGVYYHIMDHYRLLTLMANTGASTIIIDSGFVRSFRNSVHVQLENPLIHPNALPKFAGQKAELAGFVSLGLMIQMAWNTGYTCRPVPWVPQEVEHKSSVPDYLAGHRFTVRLDKSEGHADPEWKSSWHAAVVALDARFAKLFDKATHDAVVDDRVRRPFQSMQFSVL